MSIKFVIAKQWDGQWKLTFPGGATWAILDSHAECVATIRDAQLWEASLRIRKYQRQLAETTDLMRRLARSNSVLRA